MAKAKYDVIIIGAGLFGSMTAKHLRDNGYTVQIIDVEHEYAASKCSFGVWKDGWVNAKIKKKVDFGMDLLEKYAGVEEINFFNMKKGVEETFMIADCQKILDEEYTIGNVFEIKNNVIKYERDGKKYKTKAKKAVIVCAGAWTHELLNKSGYITNGIDRLWGATLEVDLPIEENRMTEWAPYKQCVLVKRNDGTFLFGDGATVKNPKSNAEERVEKASTRLLKHLDMATQVHVDIDKITQVNEGYRPYLRKAQDGSVPDFVEVQDDNLMSATGGAKNSTILCGYVAKMVLNFVETCK